MRFAFVSVPDSFDVVADSRLNAEYAHKIVDMILFDERGAPFRQGMRAAAKALDRRYGRQEQGKRAIDLAVYIAHGESGCMTPNQYWVPGMFSPMPMMGKYFVYYGLEFLPPRELGKLCVQRMVYELFSENSGVCRFHRKWVEAIIDEIISAHYEFSVDYKAHQFELARHIFAFDGDGVVFWEGERTIDVVYQFLQKWGRFGLKDERLYQWLARFGDDKWGAAEAYWKEMRAGIEEAFAAGSEAIPDNVPPYWAKTSEMRGREEA
jgi:glyceraldehyde-3-phosphate dehydrogenase (ferredoxin)